MPTPFPGMDPYLEQRGLWEDVRTRLIVAIADALSPEVQPRYRVAVEQRTYLAFVGLNGDDFIGKPDVAVVDGARAGQLAVSSAAASSMPRVVDLPVPEEVVERYLEIREVATGDVITVVELLSPTNKTAGAGRQEYENKRMQVLGSATHLVEIDLIRRGGPMPMNLHGAPPATTGSSSVALTGGHAATLTRSQCANLSPTSPCRYNEESPSR